MLPVKLCYLKGLSRNELVILMEEGYTTIEITMLDYNILHSESINPQSVNKYFNFRGINLRKIHILMAKK